MYLQSIFDETLTVATDYARMIADSLDTSGKSRDVYIEAAAHINHRANELAGSILAPLAQALASRMTEAFTHRLDENADELTRTIDEIEARVVAKTAVAEVLG